MSAASETDGKAEESGVKTGFSVWSRVTSLDYLEGNNLEDKLEAASARVEEGEESVEDLVFLAAFDKTGPLEPRYRVADLILSKGEYEGISFSFFGEYPIKVVAQMLSTTTGDESEDFFECLGPNKTKFTNVLKLHGKELADGTEDAAWRLEKVSTLLKEIL